MKIDLQARIVAAVAQSKARHDIRYYLNGVYVEPHPMGALVVATNGHAMTMWLDESGTIDRPAILRIGIKLQAALKGSPITRLQLVDGRLAVTNRGAEVHIQNRESPNDWEVPGKFPDYSRVIPESTSDEPGLKAAINPEYIHQIERALLIGTGHKMASITMRQADKNAAIAVTSISEPNFFGVIMPLRENDAPRPSWIHAAKIRREMSHRAAAAPLPVHEPSDAGPPDGDVRGWRLVTGGN